MRQGVPPGGPSTNNGVLLQLLWSLLRTTRLRVSQCQQDNTNGEVIEAFLRLEPIGGGGDIQEKRPSEIIVEQVKARSDGSAWSLREVIDEVLPDLYRADPPATQYRFITEGKMGRWERVYNFFRSLSSRAQTASDILSALDSEHELPFAKGGARDTAKNGNQSYWQQGIYSERSLFEHIVSVIRHHKPERSELVEETQRKVWHLLGHFEMVPIGSKEKIESAIDDSLLAMGCPNTNVATMRRAMLADLMERATAGDADIHAEEFLSKYGLSIPISNWLLLKTACNSVLRRYLRNRNYDVFQDVRMGKVSGIASAWTENVSLVVLSGESGQGKTWAGSGTSLFLSEQRLVVTMEATGDAEQDVRRAERVFCEDVWGVDTTLSFNRISARLKSEKQNASPQWLTLYIDGVQNADEARNLAQMDWDGWGVRLLISCSSPIADVFEGSASSRVKRIAITDFTLKELHVYLSRNVGINWPHIRQDVRNTLRRPLLAGLYCAITAGTDWHPTNEYDLYSRYWHRIREQAAGAHSMDGMRLSDLARQVISGTVYPWSERSLHKAGIDDSVRNRLVKVGWLRSMPDGCCEVVHSRLLNWAVAEGLVAAYREQEMAASDLIATVQNLFNSQFLYSNQKLYSNQNLGYVPMDVFWMLTGLSSASDDIVDDLILALEQENWHYQSALYQDLLPTLGKRIIMAHRIWTRKPAQIS